MKRHYDDSANDVERQSEDLPRSRASGYTDQELESRFSSQPTKSGGGEELMDEATIKRLMRQEREQLKDQLAGSQQKKAEPAKDVEPPVAPRSPSPVKQETSAPKVRKVSRWENRRAVVDDSEAVAAAAALKSPSPPPRKSSRWGGKASADSTIEAAPRAAPALDGEGQEAGARASAGAAASFSPGDLVSLKGLQAAAHLNGEKARLVRLDPGTGRWEVRLLKSCETKAIKPANLEAEDSDDDADANATPADHWVAPKSPEQAPSSPKLPASQQSEAFSEPPVAPPSPPPQELPPPSSGRAPMGVAGLSSISQLGAIGQPTVAQRFEALPVRSTKPSKPARQMGTIRWYNGRRKLGMIIPDDGGKDLYIPAQGASNGSQVPPQPGGLFHGTRVSFVPTALKSSSSSSAGSDKKEIVCMDVRALAGQAGLSVGVETFIGGKEKNDDRIAAMDLHELGFLAGIFDGHLGHECAEFASKQVPSAVLTSYRARVKREAGPGGVSKMTHAQEARLIEKSFVDAFEEVDKAYLVTARKKEMKDGSTGVVALVSHGFETPVGPVTAASLWPPDKNAVKQTGTVSRAPGGVAKLFAAWCGDSRCVLLRGRAGLRCTEDHRPNRRDEQNRVKLAGGLVAQDSRGTWRVGPKPDNKYAKELDKRKKGKDSSSSKWYLATSRSFGDIALKVPDPIVIATPEVKVIDLVPEDWAVIIGSDGIFDALTDQGVADVLWKAMAINGRDPVGAAKEVVQAAFRGGSKDNLTAVVMRFGWAAAPSAESGAPAVEKKKDAFDMFG